MFNNFIKPFIMLFESILSLLKTTFSGVREDGLNQLARTLALTVDTEEAAKAAVAKLSADAVTKFVQDWRKDADAEITKANKTYEDGLKKKYNFVEKQEPTPPQPTPAPGANGLSAEDVAKIVTEAVSKATQPLQAQIDAFKGGALQAEREKQLVNALGDKVPQPYKDAVIDGFRARTFENEEDFTNYLNTQKTNAAAMQQQVADAGLGAAAAPNFGTVNKDGVSAAVQAYIASKAEEANGEGLGGKVI